MGWWKDQMERSRTFAADHKFDAVFQGARINGGEVSYGFKTWPVADCSAQAQTGAELHKMSLGRVAGGAVLLGPLGAVLGGMAKKDKTKVYVALQTPDGPQVIEGPAKDQAAAMTFAARLNAAAEAARAQ
ncbi:hypothetical protein [Brooklawnia cerclae]|uniref:Lipoprotein n=1 Tax=Brooklawnia cerclae TaxID=349934 RepID=A0ABX0SCZ4_9ACTN|nr:hypothetical protein [Brooklawnia cerclae]NIH56255.1 hypothetical protein [Brooklawnia cerclae]